MGWGRRRQRSRGETRPHTHCGVDWAASTTRRGEGDGEHRGYVEQDAEKQTQEDSAGKAEGDFPVFLGC